MSQQEPEVIKRGELAPNFKRQLTALREQRTSINSAQRLLSKAYLTYATNLVALLDEAKRLDKSQKLKNNPHQASVLSEGSLDGTQLNESTVSKWRKIAAYAPKLMEHQRHLPSSRDHLYEVALAVEAKKNIGRLIKDNQLSVDSSYLDCRRLHKDTETTKAKGGKTPSRRSGSLKKETVEKLKRDAVELPIHLNSLPFHNPKNPPFSGGYAVALIATETDRNSGVEKLKLLTVLNDEKILSTILKGLES